MDKAKIIMLVCGMGCVFTGVLGQLSSVNSLSMLALIFLVGFWVAFCYNIAPQIRYKEDAE
jgi:hypothetical protein